MQIFFCPPLAQALYCYNIQMQTPIACIILPAHSISSSSWMQAETLFCVDGFFVPP